MYIIMHILHAAGSNLRFDNFLLKQFSLKQTTFEIVIYILMLFRCNIFWNIICLLINNVKTCELRVKFNK